MNNWYIKLSGLDVTPLGFSSDGYLTLSINGKIYRYNIPGNPQDYANKFFTYKQNGWGKQVKRLLDTLDKFLVK